MASISIVNDSNNVLIDDLYRNYVPVHVANYSPRVPHPTYPQYSVENGTPFSYTGHADSVPILAVVVSSGVSTPIPLAMWRSGNTFYWRLYRAEDSSAAARIVVLDVLPSAYSGTGLVIVRDAQGRVTYDSDRPYMKVLDVMVGAGSSPRTYPGKVVGTICGSPAMGYGRVVASGAVGVSYAATFLFRSGDSVVTSARTFRSSLGYGFIAPGGWGNSASIGPSLNILVDLTGIA